MLENDEKHRAETKRVIGLTHVLLLGATVTNAALFVALQNSRQETLEVRQATQKVTSFLESDGYENVRGLDINYADNSFSFSLYNSKHFLSCTGYYRYEKNTVTHIGNVSCTNVDLTDGTVSPGQSV